VPHPDLLTEPEGEARRGPVSGPGLQPVSGVRGDAHGRIDGVVNKIHPGDPLDKNIYALSPEEAKGIPTMPGSLDEAVRELEADHEFLLQGGVFSQDLIDSWIDYKRENDIDPVRLRPHPHEFELYYDV